jgi:IclR family acetate operon transcriptional repressor
VSPAGQDTEQTAAPPASLRQPIRKAVQILAHLVDSPAPDCGVRELARDVGIPAATVHRVLSALADEDFVASDPVTGRWSLGPEFWRLALRGGARLTVSAVALGHLERLVADSNETAFLCVYDPTKRRVMFAASVESKQPIRHVVELHEWAPVNLAASSLAILAYLPEAEIRAVCATGELASVDGVWLRTTLGRIRQQGYAQTRGVRVAGAVGLAAPVCGVRGEVLGSVGVTIPEQRFARESGAGVRDMVVRCARAVSDDMFAPPAAPQRSWP